jgi:hypothetical protein
VRTAVAKTKPLVLVCDPMRGGAALDTIKQEECPKELLGVVFDGRKVIEWRRIKDFQLVSLKLIATELIWACPGFANHYHSAYDDGVTLVQSSSGAVAELTTAELTMLPSLYADIYVRGEITELQLNFKGTARMYASPNNPGANKAATVIQRGMVGLELSSSPPPSASHFLLYLAHQTWVGEAGERLAEEVRNAMRTNQSIVMLHENDMQNGGCEFDRFFSTTPQDIIANGLYKALAVAYYPGPFRPVSVKLVAKCLGGSPSKGLRLWNWSRSPLLGIKARSKTYCSKERSTGTAQAVITSTQAVITAAQTVKQTKETSSQMKRTLEVEIT